MISRLNFISFFLTHLVVTSNGFSISTELARASHSLPFFDSNYAESHNAIGILQSYTHILQSYPLSTKMLTGGILATCGDAVAQSTNDEEMYDLRRAASFATFDMAYRALQHMTFPILEMHLHGELSTSLIGAIGLHSILNYAKYLAPLEQTLASQLGIVPFIYYPIFFSLTGYVQGLTMEQTILRARENFFPLMKRNLIFWIPVQFVQFAFIPHELQIPFLSVCGLCWTFILSMYAGSTKTYSDSTSESAFSGEDNLKANTSNAINIRDCSRVTFQERKAEFITRE
jgi:Mpv17 / PMP22 family